MPENLSRKLRTETPIWAWLADPLSDDIAIQLRRVARAPDMRHIAVMPDVHLAADVCVGAVLATDTLVYPQAIGGDIGCGISAMQLGLPSTATVSDLDLSKALRALQQAAPVLKRSPTTPSSTSTMPGIDQLSDPSLRREAARTGTIELGTLGRGNHFLELQLDVHDGSLWLVVHSGSRAMGQLVKTHHIRHATRAAGNLWHLDVRSDRGKSYLHDMEWCTRYAETNRLGMLYSGANLLAEALDLAPQESSVFGTAHNFVRRERHGDSELLVHRKGAGDAAASKPSTIPGSMGGLTHFVTGRGEPRSLGSSSHGAGRRQSRTDARRSISKAALVSQLQGVHIDPALVPYLAEEAPSVYKDLQRVMRAQRDLVRIDRTLRTLVCHKGV